ncbi:monovalent cation/H+ antiporter subunit D family protein [bacterium]|nr:monovalent cation/H+ antiporter subunit D family protein [bacterium]
MGLEFLNIAPQRFAEQAPALVVVGPLIAACAAVLAPGRRWAWFLCVGASAFAFWMAVVLASEVARQGVISYAMGGFPAPLGIEFRVDALSAMFALLISGMAVLTAVFSGESLETEIMSSKHPLMQGGFLTCLAGLLGLVLTGDAFNAFVFLEISSIGVYAMIAMGGARDRRAYPAAFNYLIMGTIGATFYLIGVGFLYAATGTLNMADIAARIPTLTSDRSIEVGLAFILIGLALKAAVFPLHQWLPAAYSHAPSMIVVFLSATATKASVYLIIRYLSTVFAFDWQVETAFMAFVLAPLSVAGILICSMQAAVDPEIRRILAYSSVAQVGYMTLAIATATSAGVSAALFHLFNHGVMKAALFMAIGGAAIHLKSQRLSDFAGAAKSAPWTMTAFGIAALSLLGAPLTAGFLSKLRLIQSLVAADWGWAAAVIGLSSLIGVFYVGRIFEVVFFRSEPEGGSAVREAPVSILLPLWLLAIANIWFGIDATIPLGLAESAAGAVMGATTLSPAGAP